MRGHYERKLKPVRIDGGVAYVPLTQGYEAIIDADLAPIIGLFNWHCHKTPTTVYAIRNTKRAKNYKQKTIKMHRIIARALKGMDVDHINGNGLDNRRSNLRLATRQQNCANQRPSKTNVSGFTGVTPHRRGWVANICHNYQNHYLGKFPTAELANEARQAKAKELFGEFARKTA